MISNERPSPVRRHSSHQESGGYGHHTYAPKPHVPEDTLRTEKLQVERKTFVFTLKENARGRFLRITEDVNGRRDNIIIPTSGLVEFKQILDSMVEDATKPSPSDEGGNVGEEGEAQPPQD